MGPADGQGDEKHAHDAARIGARYRCCSGKKAVATSDCRLQYVAARTAQSGAPIPPREFGTQRHDEVVDVSAQCAGGERGYSAL
jgi:hypothetical protein